MRGLDRMEDDLVEDVFLQEGLRPTIAEHAAQCNSLFRKYMVLPDIVPDPTVMDDQLARFTLWTSNMDVYGPLNVSLDYRLRFSPTVVDIIHQLLDVICDTLASCKLLSASSSIGPKINGSMLMEIATTVKPINEPPPQTPSRKRQRISEDADSRLTRRDDDDASDSDSDVDQAEENFSKITDTIGGTVSRLFRLSNAVRKSAKTNRAMKIERYTDDKEANENIAELSYYTECYIKFRFPMAPESLRLALMKANELRLRRLYYQRSHRRHINLTVQNPQTKPPEVQLPKIKESAPAVRFAPSALPKPATTNRTSGQGGPPVVPVTTATTARQTDVGALLAKSVTEVPRAKSVLVNNKLSFPPLPPTQECPYCSVIIEFKNSNKSMMWNNHVIGDLEPFICVFPHCLEAGHQKTGPLTFESSKAWIGHMQNAHGHTWECRAPSHPPKTFDQELDYQKHSIEEHGVPEEHAGMLSSAARRPALNKLLECPFGDDFQPPEKAESSAVFSSDALQLHVAAHIKEIALLTLQKLPSDDDAKSIKSDDSSEDDGQGVANVRRSMYSLLDDEDLDFQQDNSEVADVTGDPREEDIRASVSELDLEDKDEAGMTKLHRAVQAGDRNLVESLINEGANLNSRDNSGRTALHYASLRQSRDYGILFLLLKAGSKAAINLTDDSGQTLLHYEAESGRAGSADYLQILIDHGADPRITDKYGFSPFLWAVVAGQEQTTSQLLRTDTGTDVNSRSGDGRSALAWAAGLRRHRIASWLLERGASMSTTRDSQIVPLNEAAASGNLDTVRLLLDHRGDPNYRDRDGWSAIHWAAEEGHPEIVALLLDRGANVNAVSSYGTSPLHCAANGGVVSIVRMLLENGADPLKSTCHGWTALHHAAFMGHSEVVQFLLEYDHVRSSASQQDNHGWSVLHLAVHNRDLATINVLMDSSLITEPRALFDESGLTAEEWLDLGPTSHSYKATSNLAFSKSRCCRAVTGLRQAVAIGNIPMIRLFIGEGYPVNGMDSGRRTALYYAAKKRMLPIMDLLLNSGADPNILPVGRKTWEEFISDSEVLQRLHRAGYQRQDTNPELERQIRRALRPKGQFSIPDRTVSFAPEVESVTPMSWRPTFPTEPEQSSSSVPVSSTPSVPDHSTSSTPMESPAPTPQTNDNKRKSRTVRSRATGLWKRLIG
ncbi:Ankyrin-2 [Trichoderma lentiforme]|uniref:Ankyrin-2 n=1 Tax=Trichoderma lentiforme TaxID=1567552 RepID=A0A9P4XEF4_9HYPO|nr:Ankyrin-2 [Trichoderma lentiforme]